MLTGCIPLQPRPDFDTSPESKTIAGGIDPRSVFERFDTNRPMLVDIPGAMRQQRAFYEELTQGINRYRALSQGRQQHFYEELTREVTVPLTRMIRQTRAVENAIKSHAKKGTLARQDGAYVIPPGGMLTYTQKGFCMDPNKPAPVKGDALTLMPATERISEHLMPLYQALGRWSNTAGNQHQAQSLTWMLMSAGQEGVHAIERMSPRTRRVWNEIMPGGADLLIREHNSRAATTKFKRALSKSLGLEKILPPAILNQLLSPNATNLHLEDLIRQGERMAGGKGIGYSTLAQGIYARGTGSAPLSGTYSIINAGVTPFVFDPTRYMAKPSAEKQFVSGTSLISDVSLRLGEAPSLKEAGGLSELTVTGMSDVSKFLAEAAWKNAWQSLYKKTPAGMDIAKRLSGTGVAKNLGAAATALPVVGNAISIYEAISGKDAFTGETLGAIERTLAIIGTVPGLQTMRTLAKAIDSPIVTSAIRRGEPLFALQTKTEGLRTVADFSVSDFATSAGLGIAEFNESTKETMRKHILTVDLPWNAPTQDLIAGLKSGSIKW